MAQTPVVVLAPAPSDTLVSYITWLRPGLQEGPAFLVAGACHTRDADVRGRSGRATIIVVYMRPPSYILIAW